MVDRLDEERLEILRGWGAGLAGDTREELRAAGKAITVLIDEIENKPAGEDCAETAQRMLDRLCAQADEAPASAPAPVPVPRATRKRA